MGMTVNAMAGMQAASETVSDYSVTAKAAERHHIPSTR